MMRKILVALVLGLGLNLQSLFAVGMAERAALVAPEILPLALPLANFLMDGTDEKIGAVPDNIPSPLVGEGQDEGKGQSPISSVTPAVRRRGSSIHEGLDSRLRGNDGKRIQEKSLNQAIKKIESRLPKKNFSAIAGLGALSTVFDGTQINMSGGGLDPEENGKEGILSKLFNPIQAIKTIGIAHQTSDNTGFKFPTGIAVDRNGLIYVVDRENNRIQILDPAGKYLRTLGMGKETSKNEGFAAPQGISLDAEGRIYVADTNNHRIQIFEPYPSLKYMGTIGVKERKHLLSWKKTPTKTYENDGFYWPRSVFVDPTTGRIYVSDTNNHRIQILDQSWKYLRTIGTGKETADNNGFNYPWNVSSDSKGRLYIADFWNNRIQILDHSGKYLHTLGSANSKSENFNRTAGIFVDSKDRLYVTDLNNHRIQIFDPNGKYLRTLGTNTETTAPTGFHWPRGVFVDHAGLIYVADTYNHRIQIFPSLEEMDAADKKRQDEAERFLSQKVTIPPEPQPDSAKNEKSQTALERFKIDWGDTPQP